jgi:hypothetical protein
MSEAEAPAAAGSEGTPATETALPVEAVPTPEHAPGDNAAAKAEETHRRRIIEAAKIERRTLQAQRAAEEREAKLAAREKEIEERYSKASEFDKAIAEAKRNPLGFLDRTGLTIEDLVRAKLSDGQDISPELRIKDAESRSAAETKSVRDEVERLKKTLEERDQREHQERVQHAVRAIATDIDSTLRGDPDRYELTILHEQQGEVLELMQGTYRKSKGKTILSPAEAADMIENYLVEQTEKGARAKKIAARLAATSQPAATPPTQAKQIVTDARAKSASLTNSAVTSPATPTDAPGPVPSREEFIERAKAKVRAKRLEKESAAKSK